MSDYLEKKWRLWFKLVDVDHDNQLTTADMEKANGKFEEIRKYLGVKDFTAEFSLKNWWDSYFFRKGSGVAISEDEFVAALQRSYADDKMVFLKDVQNCLETFGIFLAGKRDRFIEKKEFQFIFDVFGQKKEEMDKAYDKFLLVGNGKPTVGHIVDAFVYFVTEENDSKPDLIMEMLKK